MKKVILAAVIAGVSLLILNGCHIGVHGSGVRKTEKREVGPFTAIDTSGALDVEVTCQKPLGLELEGDDNILPLIETDVVDGVLRIKTTKHYSSRSGITVRITVPNLERIQASGAGKFHVTDLKSDRFVIYSTGVVSTSASGQTKYLRIEQSGAGRVDTHSLRAAAVDVNVSGAASVDVNASDELNVTVSGAANVTYSGDPKVTKRVSGAGSISKKESRGV